MAKFRKLTPDERAIVDFCSCIAQYVLTINGLELDDITPAQMQAIRSQGFMVPGPGYSGPTTEERARALAIHHMKFEAWCEGDRECR